MLRRLGALGAAAFALNLTGCSGLVDLITLPVRLLFNVLGGLGSAIGIAYATPPEEPALVRAVGPEQWEVAGLSREVPCTIECTAPGFAARVWRWPEDFEDGDQEIVVRLDTLPASAEGAR